MDAGCEGMWVWVYLQPSSVWGSVGGVLEDDPNPELNAYVRCKQHFRLCNFNMRFESRARH